MASIPRFVVVTMEAGEADLPHCIEAIKGQKGVEVVHHLVSNFPEMEAHNECYGIFNTFDPTYLRAKVDADMVLSSEWALWSIADQFDKAQHIQNFTAMLDDFMTGAPLYGVQFYAPSVRFKVQADRLACDRDVTIPAHLIRRDLDAPVIGKHMHFCSPRSAFRFGFHRGMKGQGNVFSLVRRAHERLGDKRRLLALKGFEMGLPTRTSGAVPVGFNYTDAEFEVLFHSALRNVSK